MTNVWIPWGIGFLVLVGVLYRWAYVRGYRRGQVVGSQKASIALRQQALNDGTCPICQPERAYNSSFHQVEHGTIPKEFH